MTQASVPSPRDVLSQQEIVGFHGYPIPNMGNYHYFGEESR